MKLNKFSAYSICAGCVLFVAVTNAAGQQTPVPLGTASDYGVLAGTTITNTGTTTINGDLGLSPGSAVTGSPVVTGISNIDNPAAVTAKHDLNIAYLNAAGRAGPTLVVAGALGGKTLTPGLYKDDGAPASLGLIGTLTLDFQGDPNAVFIFQSAATLITGANSTVALINTGGGKGCNVYWQLGSAATLGTGSIFVGTILAHDDISLELGATVAGRLLAGAQADGAGAVTLKSNTITPAICSVAPTPGSIKVVKNTVGGNGIFTFTSNFGLTTLTTVGGTASQTISGLTPGSSFSVSETAPLPSGWTQTSASCTSGSPAAITVTAETTTTCTFTNAYVAPPTTGSIRVVKRTVGGEGTFTFTSNFGLGSMTTIGGTASQTFSGLTPSSSFSVSETVPSGWTLTSASCTNGTPAAFTVVADGTTICTFLNTKAAPTTGSIQVVKRTVGGDGTFTFTSNFGLGSMTTVGGTASPTFSGLTPGSSFSVSETVPPGWTQTSASCSNGTPAAIIVVAGATTTCTILNTKAATPTGSILVVKKTVGGDGTFTFTSNFGLGSMTTSGGTASQTFSSLTPGSSFSVSETVPTGWAQTSASCSNGTPAAITVVADGTTTCTFLNTKESTTTPDVTIRKSHTGNFRQGDAADTYTLTVTNPGQGPTTGAVTVSDTLPAGLTATAISGAGWSCTLASLTCTRNDALAAGAGYPVITVTVSVANNALAFVPPAGSPAFQAGDILISMADGTVQWRRPDWSLVKVLAADAGQAKGLAFGSSGLLFVTHWYGAGSSGNDVVKFDSNGNRIGLFGDGYNCNPSSFVFDNSGNAYVGQADCSNQIFKFDSSGNLLAKYDVAIENRGTYHIVLDPNQCTMYYTSEGSNVKRFNVCTNTQMSNFNTAPLPDPATGAQQFALVPGGGMLVADFSVIASLDASGNFVRTYGAPGSNCWLGMALDSDGTSFWASDWCASTVTHFDMATGKVIESHVVADTGFMIKQIAIPGNIFSTTVINTAAVAGGGELNTSNDSASDVTVVDPPRQPTGPGGNAAGAFNAASYAPVVAAGSIASVFGNNLSTGQAIAGTIPLPSTLASSSFQIGGQAAPLFFASPDQVDLQIPWELAGQTQAMLTGTVGAATSIQQMVSMAPFAPGLFTLEAGSSQGVVMIADTQLLAASPSGAGRRPVTAGEFITLYGTGLGAVSNQPATGMAAQSSPYSVTTTTPTVTIGGIPALVSFSRLAPGSVGLYQVNVQVPVGVLANDAVPVILLIGGVSSNVVTIAVE